ncbi:MAG: hypothetical protein HQ537_00440 [Parcubacteria group bacterium]|nr:hypothetical protein [Parcubacteria group bacterium]
MNLSIYLAGLVLTTLLASACLVAILIYFNPNSSDLLIFILFYLSLFISSTGVFTLSGLIIRWFSQRKTLRLRSSINKIINQLEISFRQGLLLSVILIAVLILQSQRALTWWYLIILVGLVGLIEYWLGRR